MFLRIEPILKRYAILCGSAKEDYEQTKISLMHEKLLADGWAENEITFFPNGVKAKDISIITQHF